MTLNFKLNPFAHSAGPGPKRRDDGLKRAHKAPRWPNNGPKMAPRGPRRPLDGPKMVPRDPWSASEQLTSFCNQF